MTVERTRRVLDAIAECDRFIAKEGPRDADLRPADVAKHLQFCEQRRLKLIAMLAEQSAQGKEHDHA